MEEVRTTRWLSIQDPAKGIELHNKDLDRFAQVYNNERPHRALGRRTRPKPTKVPRKQHPTYPPPAHTDKIDDVGKVSLRYQGKLLHLGVGRAHIGADITVLVADNAATVIHTTTGEILGEYTLDATKNYQPKKKKSPAEAEDQS
ncbi:hypothetical protein [Arthrobacter sp. HLT1-20]